METGSSSIAVTHNEAWAGLYLGSETSTDVAPEDQVVLSVHGGSSGGQQLTLYVADQNLELLEAAIVTPQANQWTQVVINLGEIGAPTKVNGVVLQDGSGGAQPTYYVDNVAINDVEGTDPVDPGEGPTITIDASTVVREISEDIYGLNFADPSLAADIDLPVDRWGGNSTTRYNYQLDVSNKASDFFFENIPNEVDNVAALPFGSSSDRFVAQDQAIGADTIMTIGTIGWTPKSREIDGGFSVSKYGPQQVLNMYRPDHGNGVDLNGNFIVGNDPTDTSIAVDETFAAGWVEHLVSQFGTADQGGVQYYALDNEPMLWNSTHRDVHPEPASYDEVFERGVRYAEAIKAVDPSAEILGPTVWGWTGYFYSALDVAGGGAFWENPQDRNAHGGKPFVPWYLEQMADYEADTGTRLLDYLDIHYYPQNTGVALQGAGNAATQQQRLESTRSLWDPTYTDETWIADEVQLIPRMREWIDQNYPDTKLAITEYNFGANEHINGAVTQADVLGIFGREGVDLATHWAPPEPNDPVAYAFRMYRNYDGAGEAGSRFGETGVQALTTDAEQVSAFASVRESDGALTIMLINKSTTPLDTPIKVSTDFANVAAEVYTYDASNLNQIVRGEDMQIVDGTAEISLPGYSITLLELPGESTTRTTPGDFDSDGDVDSADRTIMVQFWTGALSVGEGDRTFEQGDADGDGDVDTADATLLTQNWTGAAQAISEQAVDPVVVFDLQDDEVESRERHALSAESIDEVFGAFYLA